MEPEDIHPAVIDHSDTRSLISKPNQLKQAARTERFSSRISDKRTNLRRVKPSFPLERQHLAELLHNGQRVRSTEALNYRVRLRACKETGP